jgi:hypothetical protein
LLDVVAAAVGADDDKEEEEEDGDESACRKLNTRSSRRMKVRARD